MRSYVLCCFIRTSKICASELLYHPEKIKRAGEIFPALVF
jgi:hypothetical protein